MRIFDFHTHIFPDDLAPHALGKLAYGNHTVPFTDGTLKGTIAATAPHGISGFLTLHIATNVKQQANVNNFAIATQVSGAAYAFGSVHPNSPDALSELKRIKQAGLKGIKMHPDYQDFYLASKSLYPIYDLCRDLDLTILFHAGHDPAFKDLKASPDDIKTIAKDFKGLKFVAAHFGGLMLADKVADELAGKAEVYLDTSCAVGFIDDKTATKIISRHGAENILFGSDCPWGSPKQHFEFIDSLLLSDNQKELIFSKNAERLLEKL